MNAIEIEVMSQHYMGKLIVKPIYKDNSLFSVYLKEEMIGRVQPVQKNNEICWYSHEINDKELLDQIGEWIAHHFHLTSSSFKKIYDFNW